jgi:hypothetical protein
MSDAYSPQAGCKPAACLVAVRLAPAVLQLLSYSRLGWLAGLPCALSVDFDSDVAAAVVAIAVGPAFSRCTL